MALTGCAQYVEVPVVETVVETEVVTETVTETVVETVYVEESCDLVLRIDELKTYVS